MLSAIVRRLGGVRAKHGGQCGAHELGMGARHRDDANRLATGTAPGELFPELRQDGFERQDIPPTGPNLWSSTNIMKMQAITNSRIASATPFSLLKLFSE